MFTFVCETVEDTQALAAHIGRCFKGGEVCTFISDLGGGKTAFVKGLARGMGVKSLVQSPTFTVSQVHHAAGGRELHHFDFYRLNDAGIMRAELAESLAQPNAVVAIEWGDIVHDILPADQLTVRLTTGENEQRIITIDCSKRYDHIMTCLQAYKNQKGLA